MAGLAGSTGGRGVVVLIAVALSSVAAAGCGGSSSGTTGATSAESTGKNESSARTSPSPRSSAPAEARTSPPTRGFSKRAKLAAFGYEARAAERQEASDILERNLKARAVGDYATQCKTLSQPVVEAIEKSRYRQNCENTLKIEDLLIPPKKTADTMKGPIAALRVQGPVGFALYHGKGGTDYAMRMERENGKWMVGEVLTAKLP
jgi:hypothetical protein